MWSQLGVDEAVLRLLISALTLQTRILLQIVQLVISLLKKAPTHSAKVLWTSFAQEGCNVPYRKKNVHVIIRASFRHELQHCWLGVQ